LHREAAARRRPVTAARRPIPLLLAACAVLAAGCGGGGGDAPQPDAATVLARALGPSAPVVRRARLDLRIDVRGAALPGLGAPLALTLDGPFSEAARAGQAARYDLDLRLRTGTGSARLGSISTGDRAWLVLGDEAYALAGPPVAAAGQGADRPGLRGLGVDPRRWLRGARVTGSATLDGASVDRLEAGVDPGPLLADVRALLGRAGGAAAAGGGTAPAPAVRSAQAELLAGRRDHVLRRVDVDLRYTGARGRDGRLRLRLELRDVGRPQPIGPPAHDRPIGDLDAAVRQLSSALQRRKAADRASGATNAYERCLADAAGDLARAQGCSGLVGR
jgi:hypothetical protein